MSFDPFGGQQRHMISATTSFSLFSLDGQTRISVPVQLTIPLTDTVGRMASRHQAGCDKPRVAGNCSGRGTSPTSGVVDGDESTCPAGWFGQTCNETASCMFWDTASGSWSSYGCTALNLSRAKGTPVLWCSCNHTTDFAAFAAEVIPFANLGNFSLNLIDLDGIRDALTWEAIKRNPVGISFTGGVWFVWLIMCFVFHRHDSDQFHVLTVITRISLPLPFLPVPPPPPRPCPPPPTRPCVLSNHVTLYVLPA